MMLPKQVKIVEVSPRDGLQNESEIIPTGTKIELINLLSETGLKVIEAGSFVSPKWIPQLSDTAEVLQGITPSPGVAYPVLVPNRKGFDNALAAGAKEIAVFTSPSEAFTQRNTNATVRESVAKIAEIIALAQDEGIAVRGYLSCVLGCPYEGEMAPRKVSLLAHELYEMGCEEISLGDTIGIGTPLSTAKLLETVLEDIPTSQLAVHFHDTYGLALANIYSALQFGIAIVDASVAGIGGCPYAKGATGNVATEDVVYMLSRMGIETGVDLKKLIAAGQFITQILGHASHAKVSRLL